MRRYITLPNIIYLILTCFVINSFTLVKAFPLSLVLIIPLFIVLNIIPGMKPKGTKKLRIRLCNHGTVLLGIFAFSLIPSLIWHITLAFFLLPHSYLDLIFSLLFCIVLSAFIFWNGIICVYCTSVQMGIKWRLVGAICGMIPIANLVILTKIIRITAEEIEFEIEKEAVTSDPTLSSICKTKDPIVLVHGIFFRENKILDHWG